MTVKAFNKWRNQLYLCRDNFGKVLHPYDYVRVTNPSETSAIWCSRIIWHPLDGAHIFNRPAVFDLIDKGLNEIYSRHLDLRRFYLTKEEVEEQNEWNSTLQKITYKEYSEWFEETLKEYPFLINYYE